MVEGDDEEWRVASLCKGLGDLWSENELVNMDEIINGEDCREYMLTLMGKFLSNPNVNF